MSADKTADKILGVCNVQKPVLVLAAGTIGSGYVVLNQNVGRLCLDDTQDGGNVIGCARAGNAEANVTSVEVGELPHDTVQEGKSDVAVLAQAIRLMLAHLC